MENQAKRVAIVTGAAHGIGKAVAERLLAEGHDVALLDIDGAALAGTVAAMAAPGRCLALTVDMGDPGAVKAAVAQVAAALGPPGIVVNNAGFARDGAIDAMPLEDWTSVHDVHLRGAFVMCQQVLPHMAAAGWGRIVNISSISALGHADRVNYCAAKAGLNGLTKALAVELGPRGITVNAVAPGLIVTRMTSNTAARLGRPLQAHLENAVASIPVRRAGRPEDVANAAAFFSGEDAGFITGQVLYVAGEPCA